jgi:hypothetical protein
MGCGKGLSSSMNKNKENVNQNKYLIDRVCVWENPHENLPALKEDILKEYNNIKDSLIDHHTGYRMIMSRKMPSTAILDKEFNKCFEEYSNDLNLNKEEKYSFSDWILIGWTVPNRGMELHNDHIPDVSLDGKMSFQQPLLTTIFYLSHDCEGGNLDFPDLNFTLKPNNGTLIIFPSEYNHEVLNYLSGERIVIQKFVFKESDDDREARKANA